MLDCYGENALRIRDQRVCLNPVVVVWSELSAKDVAERLAENPELVFRVVGVLLSKPALTANDTQATYLSGSENTNFR